MLFIYGGLQNRPHSSKAKLNSKGFSVGGEPRFLISDI